MLFTKRTHLTILQTLSALMKVHPIPHAIFQTTKGQALLKFCTTVQCNGRYLLCIFFQLKPHILRTKISNRSEFFGLFSGWMNIHTIPDVMFETTSQLFIKLCITFQCQEK